MRSRNEDPEEPEELEDEVDEFDSLLEGSSGLAGVVRLYADGSFCRGKEGTGGGPSLLRIRLEGRLPTDL